VVVTAICLWAALFAGHLAQLWAAQIKPSSHGDLRSLSLKDAVETALRHNPMISASRYLLESSRQRYIQARSGLYPHLKISERFTRTTNPMWAFGTKLNQESITRQDFDPRLLNDPDAIDNFQTAISLTYPLYDRGRIRKGIEQARLQREAASLSLETVRQEVAVSTVEAYLNVLLAKEELEVLAKSLETARAHHRMIQARYRSGLVVKSDVLRSQVHVAQLEQDLQQARAGLSVAFSALWATLGKEHGGEVRLTTSFDRAPRSLPPLQEWLKKAFDRRPDLERAKKELEIAGKELEKAKAEYYPALYLSGAYEINTEDFDESANNYTIGAVLELDLFSGFRTRARVKEAKAGVESAKARVEGLKLKIGVEVRRSYHRAESALAQTRVALSAIGQAEEALRIVRNRYESGLFHLVQLLDAETALQRARLNYIRALHQFRVAEARLALASGVVFEYVSDMGRSK